jgi:GDP/UDP-N,N'-diacetylbacillosamine 2-epimerase (hydrolysing)
MPNADTNGRVLINQIKAFCEQRSNAIWFASLGQQRYLSCLSHMDAVVGNSSSGLTEAPSFRIGTINIGDRQHGRLKAGSVIDCAPTRHSIRDALSKVYSSEFQSKLTSVVNPYGSGGAASDIIRVLEDRVGNVSLKKIFHDLPNVATSH